MDETSLNLRFLYGEELLASTVFEELGYTIIGLRALDSIYRRLNIGIIDSPKSALYEVIRVLQSIGCKFEKSSLKIISEQIEGFVDVNSGNVEGGIIFLPIEDELNIPANINISLNLVTGEVTSYDMLREADDYELDFNGLEMPDEVIELCDIEDYDNEYIDIDNINTYIEIFDKYKVFDIYGELHCIVCKKEEV